MRVWSAGHDNGRTTLVFEQPNGTCAAAAIDALMRCPPQLRDQASVRNASDSVRTECIV
jgi:hypothetical protein